MPMASVLGDLHDGQTVTDIPTSKSRRVLLKIDLVVMPLIVVSMTLAFLDKNGLAYAAIYGLRTDTHLVGQQYSWLGSIFYFGYLAMEFPNLWLISKNTHRYLYGHLSLLPCLLLVNTRWYRREEQPLRTAFWYNTFAGVFGGILSYAIGHINGSLPTWKYIFLIYGAVTMLVGIVVIFALPDRPRNGVPMPALGRVVADRHGRGDYSGVYIMGSCNAPWVLALSLQTSSTGGTTKKSFFLYPWLYSLVTVGNIIGPQFFLQTQAPHYPLGIGAMLCCFAIMTVAGAAYFVACFVSNQYRDQVHGTIEPWSERRVTAGLEADLEDLTDREDHNFRYIY
ncbi:hypothetical protein BJX66DRAFT_322089 [Aspergillus keveii]|uniref:Allantoate permease n=1 Tax=Aspergillus keveii TaxID=714993 RepID=A0ABR4GKG3_9EURO